MAKTKLSDQDEYQFRNWYDYASKMLVWSPNPDDTQHHYDIRGAWQDNKYQPVMQGQHFPDTYKDPLHDTFSVESVEAMEFPGLAGSWEKTPGPVVTDSDVFNAPDLSDSTLKKRQRYMESGFKNDAVSPKGATGAYQIMRAVYDDYVQATGKTGDLFNPAFNERVRDWKMNQLLKTKAVSGTDENGELNPKVKLVKQYAAYNWGEGNLGNYLAKQKENDVDIYHSLDWFEGLPTETKNYIRFIVFGQDVGEKTEKDFQTAAKRKFQFGGLIYQPFIKRSYDKSVSEDESTAFEDWVDTNEDYPVESVQSMVYKPMRQEKPREETEEQSTEQPTVMYTPVKQKETKKRGTTHFKSDDIDPGNLREFLDKLEDAGISVRVTSGYRPGATTKSGNPSRHGSKQAIDITPVEGQTYADLQAQIAANPDLLAYMKEHQIGIIDETDPLIKQRTGATGDHWHISIGGESLAIYGRQKLFG